MVVPHKRSLCVYVAPPCEWKRNWRFLLFASLGLKFWSQLNIKAVHNFKTSYGSVITSWTMIVPISTSLLFLVSAVEKNLLVFLAFFANFAAI